MYPVDYVHAAIEHAYPHDHVGPPPLARHIIHEALNSQVVRSVFSRGERLAALPIYR